MQDMEKIYHTLLEDTLILLRKHSHKHIDKMDEVDICNIHKLIKEIEQII